MKFKYSSRGKLFEVLFIDFESFLGGISRNSPAQIQMYKCLFFIYIKIKFHMLTLKTGYGTKVEGTNNRLKKNLYLYIWMYRWIISAHGVYSRVWARHRTHYQKWTSPWRIFRNEKKSHHQYKFIINFSSRMKFWI